MTGNLLLPGVFLADEGNPFSGIVMENVVASDGRNFISDDYICENVIGQQTGNSPKASCF